AGRATSLLLRFASCGVSSVSLFPQESHAAALNPFMVIKIEQVTKKNYIEGFQFPHRSDGETEAMLENSFRHCGNQRHFYVTLLKRIWRLFARFFLFTRK
ncbi:hypothetical protein ACFVR1_14955, partial [Psychrobacillus sp. NPDC058041]|uniref:hypothetical protein n=1 Tax=Psychrobacillus sp. NPDC058041 TaxID=3346310 RepID=UPI0036D83B4F